MARICDNCEEAVDPFWSSECFYCERDFCEDCLPRHVASTEWLAEKAKHDEWFAEQMKGKDRDLGET